MHRVRDEMFRIQDRLMDRACGKTERSRGEAREMRRVKRRKCQGGRDTKGRPRNLSDSFI